MKKKIGDLTLREIDELTMKSCEDSDEQSCDNCPMYFLNLFDCIESKCKLHFMDLDQEIEVEEK